MSKPDNLTPINVDVVLNWFCAHPQAFACGVTWLTDYRNEPAPGTNEHTLGSGAKEAFSATPWCAWFILPGHIGRLSQVRGASIHEAKVKLMKKVLELDEDLTDASLKTYTERLAVTKGVPSPWLPPRKPSL